MAKLRVFLAEDHEVIREGLKLLVNSQPDMEVVGEAGSGKQVVERVSKLNPHIVLMDISMPELSGTLATRELKRILPQVKVLALTVHEDVAYLRQFLEAGAEGYVLKRSAAHELVKALRAVANGERYVDPSVSHKLISGFVGGTPSAGAKDPNPLSGREAEVLRLIATGYSNKEIASILSLSIKTVETYKARAIEKTGLNSRAEIVRYALRQGWLQEE